VFSDDDMMADGALAKVLPFCESGKYALILPDRELRSVDMSQVVAGHSYVNHVSEPTEYRDPVSLFIKYGYWHYTFVGSLLIKMDDWYSVDKSKYINFPWFEHTCILAEVMVGRMAIVLPDALVRIRCDNNTYRKNWWTVWSVHFPHALVALPPVYPLSARRAVLRDFLRVSLRRSFFLMLAGRATGELNWHCFGNVVGNLAKLHAWSWVAACLLAMFFPKNLIVWLRAQCRT